MSEKDELLKAAQEYIKDIDKLGIDWNKELLDFFWKGESRIEINLEDMEKKEPKRDKNGRFIKKGYKTEVKLEVEPKPASKHPKMVSISKDELEQLRTERDAFKLTAEKMSGEYLDKCQEIKDLMPYKRHWDHLFGLAMTWKYRALAEQKKHLFAMDALRVASMHIWWLRSKLSWFKLWKNRKKLVEMDVEMDRMVARVEGLDRE